MKKAVILFNLGGPDSLESVEPFLFNLFNDKNIITLRNPFRFLLAKLISRGRAPIAQEIYKQIGNKSPIVEETQKQVFALENALNSENGDVYKTFISMRYWHPFSSETIVQVKEFAPDEIILLPLYPQFSTTTSKSSMDDWFKTAKKHGLAVPTKNICSFYKEPSFIESHVNLIKKSYAEFSNKEKTRILFSAHGLPEKIINNGDPYQKHVEETVALIVEKLAIDNLDYVTCYQSRVGRLKWIGPSTEDEIKMAGNDKLNLLVVPVAFVSEHSETLVELDIEYRHLANESGVDEYIRVPALGINDNFIKSLVNVCKNAGNFVCNCYPK